MKSRKALIMNQRTIKNILGAKMKNITKALMTGLVWSGLVWSGRVRSILKG